MSPLLSIVSSKCWWSSLMLPNDNEVDIPFHSADAFLSSIRAIFDMRSILSYHIYTALYSSICSTEYRVVRRDIVGYSHRSALPLVWWRRQPPSCDCQCSDLGRPCLPLWSHHCGWISAKVGGERIHLVQLKANHHGFTPWREERIKNPTPTRYRDRDVFHMRGRILSSVRYVRSYGGKCVVDGDAVFQVEFLSR